MYNLYSKDYIPCVYCSKLVSLYNSKAHLKTKKCRALQNLILEKEKNDLLLKFNKEINKTKSELYCDFCNNKPIEIVKTKPIPLV